MIRHGSEWLLLLLLCFVGGTSTVNSQRSSPPVVNPRNYVSPSRKFVLTVDPSDLYGRGSADYRVTMDGAEIWSGRKDFTLYEAGITDDGTIAGYAYTQGLEGFASESQKLASSGPGEFRVVIMKNRGELLLDEKVKRTESRFLHSLPNPLANGLLVDGNADKLVIRVADEDLNRNQSGWWSYRLSTGKLLGKSNSGPKVPTVSWNQDGTTNAMKLPAFPDGSLKLLGTFTFGESGSSNSPIHDIAEFDFDAAGTIERLRKRLAARTVT